MQLPNGFRNLVSVNFWGRYVQTFCTDFAYFSAANVCVPPHFHSRDKCVIDESFFWTASWIYSVYLTIRILKSIFILWANYKMQDDWAFLPEILKIIRQLTVMIRASGGILWFWWEHIVLHDDMYIVVHISKILIENKQYTVTTKSANHP